MIQLRCPLQIDIVGICRIGESMSRAQRGVRPALRHGERISFSWIVPMNNRLFREEELLDEDH
jgi:hypothetical protein